ncbi:MAG: hypothetical protein KDJ52_32310 [Anaerolineae bacterium]|nr:hypothetical protein [Anaerolineae bacterium]
MNTAVVSSIETHPENTRLTKKLNEIKGQMQDNVFPSLGQVIAQQTGTLIRKITRRQKPLAFWFSMTAIFLVILLAGYGVALLFKTQLSLESIQYQLIFCSLCLIFIIALQSFITMVFATSREYLLNAMTLVTDLEDLQQQIITVFSIKKQFIFALVFTIVVTGIQIIFALSLQTDFSIAITISFALINIISGSYFYFAFLGLPTVLRFSRYHYKLFTANPSKSEFIDRLSDLLSVGVYIVAIWSSLFTLFLFLFFGKITSSIIILVIAFGWAPTIAFFVINQIVLAKIITNTKWIILNSIQAQIESLQHQEAIFSEDTLKHIDTLLSYHDRIAATKNSALDVRAGLNFLNSLLLPVIALVLANLGDIIALFFT